MEVERVEKPKNGQNRKKYHVDMTDTPLVADMIEKHENDNKYMPVAERIPEEDVHRVFKAYAENKDMDVYTIAQCFCISAHAFNNLVKSDKYRAEWESIKKKRGEAFIQRGYEVAAIPFNKIQSGEEVSMVEVQAAKLLSNYCMMYGQAQNPDFNPSKAGGGDAGGVNVVVNTGIQLNI